MGFVRSNASARWGILLVLLAASLWGTAAFVAKLLFRTTDIDAIFIGFFRLALAVPVLALAGWRRQGGRNEIIPLGIRFGVARVGAFIAISHVSYYQAIRYVGVSITALVTCSIMPLMVVILSLAGGHEKLNLRLVVSLVLAICGVGFLIGGPHSEYSLAALIKGGFLSLTSALFLALVTVTGKHLAVHFNPISMATLATGAAALVLSPVFLSGGESWSYGLQGWLLLIYMGAGPTALAYTVYFAGLKRVKASAASILALAEPFTAVLMATLIMGERLDIVGWSGAAMLIGSFLLVYREAQPG